MSAKNNILDELGAFSWKDVNQMIKSGEFTSAKKQLGKEAYLFVSKEKNFSTVVELAYTSLQKTDPENTTVEQAIKIAEEMQKFAKKFLGQTNIEKSIKEE